jgi:transposase
MSKATPRINPQEYKTKAEAVLDMLKKGLSVKEIRNRMAVSESYIYLAKKKLAEAELRHRKRQKRP